MWSNRATVPTNRKKKIPYCIGRITGGLKNASSIHQVLNLEP
ncbi:uncharacterized protein G2W53_008788 [Senna tora]|uniref:Uncharacterized protein n=1 Tax=Senna tora TaxID=362788 RepID=A0A834WX11_9FABA|nr:uncharacterized protein G2W53_008788 [Senna tora]